MFDASPTRWRSAMEYWFMGWRCRPLSGALVGNSLSSSPLPKPSSPSPLTILGVRSSNPTVRQLQLTTHVLSRRWRRDTRARCYGAVCCAETRAFGSATANYGALSRKLNPAPRIVSTRIPRPFWSLSFGFLARKDSMIFRTKRQSKRKCKICDFKRFVACDSPAPFHHYTTVNR